MSSVGDAQQARVVVAETSISSTLTACLRGAFEDAMAERGKLSTDVFEVEGFSGRKIRLLFNNLIGAIDKPRYLEIGVFHGASFLAAIYQNKVRATGVDNWTEYGGPANSFYANLAKLRGEGCAVSMIEENFRAVNYAALGRFNVMFYDGSHQEADQYDGVMLPMPALEDHAIVMVDDWNWDHVRRATLAALRDADARIDFSIEVRTTFDGSLTKFPGKTSDWHNGIFAAVIAK